MYLLQYILNVLLENIDVIFVCIMLVYLMEAYLPYDIQGPVIYIQLISLAPYNDTWDLQGSLILVLIKYYHLPLIC